MLKMGHETELCLSKSFGFAGTKDKCAVTTQRACGLKWACDDRELASGEVRLLSAAKHKNLVGLVGYCEQPERDGAKILVYEYVSNGAGKGAVSSRKIKGG
ncbi:uncharacterized protein LOC131609785 isoform X2 [Vicia villosa]|uniref:uncharacterized protein LOC131609785 isoform X2 n=1 Tax=Vicia villosa TaxID=3911 RepID=UPI00273C3921|nr:uncharacterized protein LOC131609785 isoform X2 [Vicia villosa]